MNWLRTFCLSFLMMISFELVWVTSTLAMGKDDIEEDAAASLQPSNKTIKNNNGYGSLPPAPTDEKTTTPPTDHDDPIIISFPAPILKIGAHLEKDPDFDSLLAKQPTPSRQEIDEWIANHLDDEPSTSRLWRWSWLFEAWIDCTSVSTIILHVIDKVCIGLLGLSNQYDIFTPSQKIGLVLTLTSLLCANTAVIFERLHSCGLENRQQITRLRQKANHRYFNSHLEEVTSRIKAEHVVLETLKQPESSYLPSPLPVALNSPSSVQRPSSITAKKETLLKANAPLIPASINGSTLPSDQASSSENLTTSEHHQAPPSSSSANKLLPTPPQTFDDVIQNLIQDHDFDIPGKEDNHWRNCQYASSAGSLGCSLLRLGSAGLNNILVMLMSIENRYPGSIAQKPAYNALLSLATLSVASLGPIAYIGSVKLLSRSNNYKAIKQAAIARYFKKHPEQLYHQIKRVNYPNTLENKPKTS